MKTSAVHPTHPDHIYYLDTYGLAMPVPKNVDPRNKYEDKRWIGAEDIRIVIGDASSRIKTVEQVLSAAEKIADWRERNGNRFQLHTTLST